MAGDAAWQPSLADVARHVPSRTRDAATPGSDRQLGTFTPSTTPSDAQAEAAIDDAVGWVRSNAGDPPAGLPPTDEIMMAARSAAEWRAAADIELAYPNRDADVRVAEQLDRRAKDALSAYAAALRSEGAGVAELVPEWSMPAPPAWGDVML